MPGAGRKIFKINDIVYPLLKKAMLRTAKLGGDTSRKAQCSKYRKIALEEGITSKDIPEDVRTCRMQRFDSYLNFTLRSCKSEEG